MEMFVNAIIENVVQVITALMVLGIGSVSIWVLGKIGKYKDLDNVNAAVGEMHRAVINTVNELQQTVVDGLKAAAADGKLTADEIADLGEQVLDISMSKLSQPAINVLNAAGVDIVAYIKGICEERIGCREVK